VIIAAENLLCVLHGQEPEWIPVECLADRRYGEGAYIFVTHAGALPPSEGGLDLWGVEWKATGESLPYPYRYPADSLTRALARSFPDIDGTTPWVQASAQREAARGRTVVIARQVCALFERFWSLMGMERALVELLSEQDLAAALLDRITDWQLNVADRFIRIGVDAARISDDYGAQNDLILSPSLWRKMILPRLARLVARYKSAGIPVILHSCGNLTRIMDDLIDLDLAAFNIQANANDLPALKRRYGRHLCIWGGISTQATSTAGSSDQIHWAVRQAIAELGYDGRLVLEPDQIIRIPEENLIAFSQAAQKYKRLFRSLRTEISDQDTVFANGKEG
jgi:uroporphyrinogen decarboxylase